MATEAMTISASDELKLWRAPEQVLIEAQQAAVALQKRITGKKKPVIFGGEQYIEYDDWEMLAHFYGYVPKVESTEFVEYGSVQGFQAVAQLVNEHTGVIVSRAVAMCLNDEENWGLRPEYEWQDVIKDGKRVWNESTKKYVREKVLVGQKQTPMFQLLSMAQTRACAKACRNKLAWVVVLAGYKPTPAEEMDEPAVPDPNEPPPLPATIERKTAAQPAPVATPEPVRPPQVQSPKPTAVRCISEAQARRFFAIWKGSGKSKDQVDAYLHEHLGIQTDLEIPRERYNEACEWAEKPEGGRW